MVAEDDVVSDLYHVANKGARHSELVHCHVLLRLPAVERRSEGGSNPLARALQIVLVDATKCLADREREVTRLLVGLPPHETTNAGVRKSLAATAAGYEYSTFRKPAYIRSHLQPLALKLLDWDDALAEERDLGRYDEPGLQRYFDDIVDIPQVEWEALFDTTNNLDLVVNYARTWRHTYLKHIDALLARGGRLRVVLPDTSEDSAIVTFLAHRHDTTPSEFRGWIHEARDELTALQDGAGVEIYETTVSFHHAAYVFSNGAVVAFYALSGERSVPTPALLIGEGGLLDFVRRDVDRLVAAQAPRCRRVFP